MVKMIRVFMALIAVCMMYGAPILSGNANAQGVPDSFACMSIEPTGILDLFNMVDDLDEASSSGEPVTISVWGPSLSTGPAISAVERTEIEAVLESLISCVNERDAMRIFSVLSERYQALLVMDLLGGGDAISAMAEQIPVILESDTASEPLTTPEIQNAWRQFEGAENIWATVSLPVPGYTGNVTFFVAFTPGGDGWEIDDIAVYEE